MNRITRQNVESVFELLAQAYGRPTKAYVDGKAQPGAWYLDHNSAYGGFVICEMSNEGGGISNPFGYGRRSAREMWEVMSFALTALAIKKQTDFDATTARMIAEGK